MIQLENHPVLKNPVSINIRFDDFNNTIVINGDFSIRDMIDYLKKNDYISDDIQYMEIIAVGKHLPNSYRIYLSDDIINTKLINFERKLKQFTEEHLSTVEGYLYHHIIVLE